MTLSAFDEKTLKRLCLIQELLSGGTANGEELNSLFPAPGYLAGLCRKNGLAGRSLGVKRIYPAVSMPGEDTIDFYGKDDMEFLLSALSGIGKAVKIQTRKDRS